MQQRIIRKIQTNRIKNANRSSFSSSCLFFFCGGRGRSSGRGAPQYLQDNSLDAAFRPQYSHIITESFSLWVHSYHDEQQQKTCPYDGHDKRGGTQLCQKAEIFGVPVPSFLIFRWLRRHTVYAKSSGYGIDTITIFTVYKFCLWTLSSDFAAKLLVDFIIISHFWQNLQIVRIMFQSLPGCIQFLLSERKMPNKRKKYEETCSCCKWSPRKKKTPLKNK